jgi:hypothetical protein
VCAVNSIINIVVIISISIINGYTQNFASLIPPTTDDGFGKARAINE